MKVKRGEIYLADLSDGTGSEQKNMPVKQTADGMYDKYAVFKS